MHLPLCGLQPAGGRQFGDTLSRSAQLVSCHVCSPPRSGSFFLRLDVNRHTLPPIRFPGCKLSFHRENNKPTLITFLVTIASMKFSCFLHACERMTYSEILAARCESIWMNDTQSAGEGSYIELWYLDHLRQHAVESGEIEDRESESEEFESRSTPAQTI